MQSEAKQKVSYRTPIDCYSHRLFIKTQKKKQATEKITRNIKETKI